LILRIRSYSIMTDLESDFLVGFFLAFGKC
jgi:hypothetical protein